MFLTETWRGPFLSLNSDKQGSWAGRQRSQQLGSCFQLPLRGKAGERERCSGGCGREGPVQLEAGRRWGQGPTEHSL